MPRKIGTALFLGWACPQPRQTSPLGQCSPVGRAQRWVPISRIELFDLVCYLAARGQVPNDAAGEPLLAAVGNFASGHRLSRRGVRHVVDAYLRAAKVKRPRVSNHALRHTGATLAYRYTHDLRAAQDMLGHQDPKTTARYARVVNRARTNPALKVPVDL